MALSGNVNAVRGRVLRSEQSASSPAVTGRDLPKGSGQSSCDGSAAESDSCSCVVVTATTAAARCRRNADSPVNITQTSKIQSSVINACRVRAVAVTMRLRRSA